LTRSRSNRRAMSQILDYRARRRLGGATSFFRGEEYAAGVVDDY
jgi:hypothetical protein